MTVDDNNDLWGPLPDASNTEIPEDVLTQQAQVLTDKSEGLLVGDVTRLETDSQDYSYGRGKRRHNDPQIELSFDIIVPRMDNYTYRLFLIRYNMVRLYPVTIVYSHDGWEEEYCADTAELRGALRNLFRHQDTQRVISALKAHAQDPRERLRLSRKQANPSTKTATGVDDDIPF